MDYYSKRAEHGRGPHAAKKIKAALSVLFKWAAFSGIGGVSANPVSAIPDTELLRGQIYNKSREHVIADADLRIIWQAAEGFRYPFGTLVKALLLSGQRLNEIACARSSEIDRGTGCLLIPAERMKNKRVHALPLTPRMRELLDGLPRFAEADHLFSTTFGKRPISGFSKFKTRFDKAVAAIGPVALWQLHDLRRTVRTGLSRAGVSVFEAELVIAHVQSGVHGVYDRHRYDTEKLAALERWEELLVHTILQPPPANVVELQNKAAALA